VQFRLWQGLTWVFQRLPLRVSYAIADIAGGLAFTFWPRGRRNTVRNFSRVLHGRPREEIRAVARRSLQNYCRYLVDFARFPGLQGDEVLAQVRGDEPFAELDVALADGRGAVVVCMHFGNWDIGAGATAARGYRLAVVAETFDDPRLDEIVVGAREGLGMTIVKLEKAAPSMVRVLRSGGLLALLIDRPMANDGVRVNFFGREVEVPAGPARLALRTGARVIPAAFARISPNGPHVQTLADFSLAYEPTGALDTDIRCLTQQIMAAHERFIRANPDQWYMFRDMWPRRAEGAR